MKDKIKLDNPSGPNQSPEPSAANQQAACPFGDAVTEHETPKKPTITPNSQGEHELQQKWGTRDRGLNFYDRQVLDYLAPKMKEFIARQEFLFVASADRNGECDCTLKFGRPGFIRVLGDKYLMYSEFRGNGVFANSGNVSENPHIAMLMIDFARDTVGCMSMVRSGLLPTKNCCNMPINCPRMSSKKSARKVKSALNAG